MIYPACPVNCYYNGNYRREIVDIILREKENLEYELKDKEFLFNAII